MITINKSPNADARTATKIVSKNELFRNSKQHINDVKRIMSWIGHRLIEAGRKHDYSKIVYIDEFYEDNALSQNGHMEDFKQRHWFKDLHLKERHHLTDRCPNDVNLIDIIERIADITAAGMARSGVVYEDDLPQEILLKAYNNTVKLIKDNIEVL